jgi:RNA polymerase sigma factor (sigma-70 family)
MLSSVMFHTQAAAEACFASNSPGVFSTTHWSVVLAAGEKDSPAAAAALEQLCRIYWYPLYGFVRRQGQSPQDAEDLTQQFFCRLLEKDHLGKADRNRGKFRNFLLVSLKNFLINERKRVGRLKRGGDLTFLSFDAQEAEERYAREPSDNATPASAYERQWAVALVEQVFSVLREEYAATDKANLFTALKVFIWGDAEAASYAQIGVQLHLTVGAVKVAVHRLRQRFRQVLRDQTAQTVARPEDIDEELRHLIGVLS